MSAIIKLRFKIPVVPLSGDSTSPPLRLPILNIQAPGLSTFDHLLNAKELQRVRPLQIISWYFVVYNNFR